MKLSKLVAYANHLDEFYPLESLDAVKQKIDPVYDIIKHHQLQFNDFTNSLESHRAGVIDNIHGFKNTLDAIKGRIRKDIEVIEQEYLLASYRLYVKDMANDDNDAILARRPVLPEDVKAHLHGRLSRYNDWHYPGMIIRPGEDPWIDDLVALDPLYLVDINAELMAPAIKRFPQEYQNRLRTYIIKETANSKMFSQLPQGQFGFVLAYNYFNYKPLEIVRGCLQELFDCLRPGGTMAFTFNNCDKSGAVDLVERCFMCYTPWRLVEDAATKIGFNLTHMFHIDGAATWVELTKPGELDSLRAGQTLAKIVAKPKKI